MELITAEPRAEGRGVDLLIHGRLTQMLHIANDRRDVSQSGRMPKVVVGARSKADHAPIDQTGGCTKVLVAGAEYSPEQQKAPQGADCMFELVAGTGFEPVTFRL